MVTVIGPLLDPSTSAVLTSGVFNSKEVRSGASTGVIVDEVAYIVI